MADDKAKIDWKMLEASEAEPAPTPAEPVPTEAAPAELAPASSAEKIVFRCENGHRIVVAATMGGQRGKCSKCGVAVRIPTTSQSSAAKARPAQRQTGVTAPVAAAEPPAVEEASPATPADDRLSSGSGPQADHDDSQAGGQAESREDMFSGLVTASDSHVSATEFGEFSQQSPQSGMARLEPERGDSGGPINPTAALVARLFQEMEHGGIVEVHITGGSVILPEFYEPRWSAGSHGLFASRAADGTVTLTAVAWDSIQKIIVRQVEGLPDGMFE
jgi:hypothetical protein